MRDRADLFEAYAKVIRMCAGTGLKTYHGCKTVGTQVSDSEWTFTCDPSAYSFALGVVQNRFVFEGDVLYDSDGSAHIVTKHSGSWIRFSWTRPLTTHELHIKEMQDAFKRGEVVEYRYTEISVWDTVKSYEFISSNDDYEYRKKPETKPDIVKGIHVSLGNNGQVVIGHSSKDNNIEFTFYADGAYKVCKSL